MIGPKPDQIDRTMIPTDARALVLAIVLLFGFAAALPASGATETEVSLSPSSQQIDDGETTTYDVVVGTVDGGVGAYSFTVEVNDVDVAAITGVDLSPSEGEANSDVIFAEDNSSVDVAVFGADTTDEGSDVTIATITLEGRSSGSVNVTLDVRDGGLSDEQGSAYTVTEENDATLTVGGGATPTPTPAPTPTPSGTPTPTPTPEPTPTPTPTPAGTATPDETPTATPEPTDTPTPTPTPAPEAATPEEGAGRGGGDGEAGDFTVNATVEGGVPERATVGDTLAATIVLDELYSGVPDSWTLRGRTDLANVTWTITREGVDGTEIEERSYDGGTFTTETPVSSEAGVATVRLEVRGTVPAIENYTYEPREEFVLARLAGGREGGAGGVIRVWRVHHATEESARARQAIVDAEAAIADAGGATSDAEAQLERAIAAYESENFENAVSLAEDAQTMAEERESQQGRSRLLLFAGVGVVVLLVIVGGVYYYRSRKESYDPLR